MKFDFEGQQVRTVMQGEEPWFVLTDVCKVLGITQPHLVARRMDEADVTRVRVTITQVNGESATKSMNAVNESGLYDVPRHWSLTTA
ncbi:BRO-N domain-containing protein [Corynebacterium flavescens]|uniref:BRO-N domain-containing protein n=1 Tax=Corynebacterium flavescens TaxID=28028 RepID=UPI002647F516|nr:Bro-N domain-containing protein [Corynebacterium flavescens]